LSSTDLHGFSLYATSMSYLDFPPSFLVGMSCMGREMLAQPDERSVNTAALSG